MKKSIVNALVGLTVAALGASWLFTWNIATDRSQVVDALKNHVTNDYIHDKAQENLNKSELDLYFKPLNIRLDRIEKDIAEIKEQKDD